MNRFYKAFVVRFVITLATTVALVVPSVGRSDFTAEDLKTVGLTEFVIGTNAALAAANPEAYGKTFIVLSPLAAAFGMTGKFTWPKFIGGTIIVAGIGAWNVSMKDEEKSTVFRNNFLFFNAVILTAWGASKLSDAKPEDQKSLTLSLVPTREGAGLLLEKRF